MDYRKISVKSTEYSEGKEFHVTDNFTNFFLGKFSILYDRLLVLELDNRLLSTIQDKVNDIVISKLGEDVHYKLEVNP